MSLKTVPRRERPSRHELATERKSLLEQIDDVQLSLDVARTLAMDVTADEICSKAVLSLCDAVQALSIAVKDSRRTNGNRR